MATKVTIRTPRETFQVDVEPSHTMAELKAEISNVKGYATGALRLIHSGRVLKDSQIFGAMGFNEKDFIVLMISKATKNPPSTTTPTVTEPVELFPHKPLPTPTPPSIKGKEKEVIPKNDETGNESATTKIPIAPRQQPVAPSLTAQAVHQPQASSNSLSAWRPPIAPSFPAQAAFQPLASSSSSSVWRPPAGLGGNSQEQNYSQISAGPHWGQGTLGGVGDFASMAERIRTDPSMRQMAIEAIAQHDPAFGQRLRQNPGLLDSLMAMASAEADHEQLSLQTSMLTSTEKESVQFLMDLGFPEKKAIEAYLVSDKNQELAANYLLNEDASDSGGPSIGQLIREDPSLRERLTQTIAQQNPALFEAALQESTLQEVALTAEAARAVPHLEDPGFTKEKAYVICDKNGEDALNYLMSNADSTDDSGIRQNLAPTTMLEEVQCSSLTQLPTPSPPTKGKGKEVIQNNEEASNESVSTEIPIEPPQQPVAPSSTAQAIFQPQTSSSSPSAWRPPISSSLTTQAVLQPPASSNSSAWQPTAVPSLTAQAKFQPQASSSSSSGWQPPAGPVPFQEESYSQVYITKAGAQADREQLSLQNGTLTAKEKESVQYLINLGFSEKKAIEAYLVSDKNQELAVDYLLNTNDEDASDGGEPSVGQLIRQDPALRERLTQNIAQQDPALAERIKKNPALLEEVLQGSTIVRKQVALTAEESRAVRDLEELGFTRQRALDAYVICDKNKEHAINYLISNDDSGIMVVSGPGCQASNNSTPQTTTQSEGPPSSTSLTPAWESPNQSTNRARAQTISFTLADARAIGRLMDRGFTEDESVEAFFVADKNEQAALNYLLDHAY